MRPLCALGSASAIWSLVFAVVHVFWVYAYFAWPAAGRAMLGPLFERAFASPRFRAYDLVVAVLFMATGLAALALVRGADSARARFLRRGLWIAAVVFTLRGAAGTVLDALIILNVLSGGTSRMMLYDLWFLLGGILFAGMLHQRRSQGRLIRVQENDK